MRKPESPAIYRHEEIKAHLNNLADLVILIKIGNDRNLGPRDSASRNLSCCQTRVRRMFSKPWLCNNPKQKATYIFVNRTISINIAYPQK